MTETKPLMAQYQAIKNEYKDAVLLFQMGDFFECFGDDAEKISETLGIVLTSRSKSEDAPPMAGFPQKALDDYLPKLIAAGFKVAVARQIENPKNAKGIVKRAVTEVITQGTIATQQELLSNDKNYLACISTDGKMFGLAFADISTGEFKVYEDRFNDKTITELLERLSPRELLKSTKDTHTDTSTLSTVVQPIEDREFSSSTKLEQLKKHFGVPNLDPLGLSDFPYATSAASVLLDYLYDTKKSEPKHITSLSFFNPKSALHIDPISQRNLEIFYNLKTHRTEGSLLGAVDSTQTAMGHRLLYEWLSFPLTDVKQLNERYDVVDFFMQNSEAYQGVANLLHKFPDLQRLTSALGLGRIHYRHLLTIAEAIQRFLDTNPTSFPPEEKLAKLAKQEIEKLSEIVSLIITVLTINSDRGTFIKDGVNSELDKLVSLATNGEQYIKDLFNKEKTVNNLPALKLTFNNVFGYAFELSRIQGKNAPEHFIKKQTMVNAERYITEELKTLEAQVLSAKGELTILETKIYGELVQNLRNYTATLNILTNYLAKLDVLHSFATNALTKRYVRPLLTETERTYDLVGMRHPVVETTVKEFVPNDLTVTEDQNFLILTGPNMGGKSTFVRQIALLQIMAQIGSFVPAEKATLPITDQVFARIGASDDITTGKSTFMVELSEVAYIVSQATAKSLVILDEVGRGTSTYEGISLAWGIAQYIANQIGCTTIFTTHFRELTDLENISNRFINYKVNLREQDNTIYFLHTVTRGKSDKSYGIQVAKLVNLPEEIINTAFQVLENFEAEGQKVKQESNKEVSELSGFNPLPLSHNGGQGQLNLLGELIGTTKPQLPLRNQLTEEQKEKLQKFERLMELLDGTDINTLTPVEALVLVEKLKKG